MKKPGIYQLRESQIVHRNPLFSVLLEEKTHPLGAQGTFIKISCSDWVTTIPLRKGAMGLEILMIQQFRHGSDRLVWEFPGGAIEEGEDPAQGADRELLEETGARATGIYSLGSVNPNPAFMNNRAHVFLAWDVEVLHNQELDPHEEVVFLWQPLKEVVQRMGDEDHDHGIMLMALFLLQKKIASKSLPHNIIKELEEIFLT